MSKKDKHFHLGVFLAVCIATVIILGTIWFSTLVDSYYNIPLRFTGPVTVTIFDMGILIGYGLVFLFVTKWFEE
jgi:multisubunit Na+/H+ antiporter MnhB subunit